MLSWAGRSPGDLAVAHRAADPPIFLSNKADERRVAIITLESGDVEFVTHRLQGVLVA